MSTTLDDPVDPITYHEGNATLPDLDKRLVIAHVVNDVGVFNRGFAREVADRYPRARDQYLRWASGQVPKTLPFELGRVQWVAVGHQDVPGGRRGPWHHRWVVNMLAQHGLPNADNPHPLDLDALGRCLLKVAAGGERTVVMPRIGCGYGGATWDEVGPLVRNILGGLDVHVYDFPPEVILR